MDGWNTSFLLGWPIFSGYVRLFQLLQFEAASSEGFKSSRQIARTSCTSGHVGAPNSAYGSWQGREQRFHRPAVLNNSFVSLEVELNRTTNSNGKVEDNSGVQIIKKTLCNCQMINLYMRPCLHITPSLSLSLSEYLRLETTVATRLAYIIIQNHPPRWMAWWNICHLCKPFGVPLAPLSDCSALDLPAPLAPWMTNSNEKNILCNKNI